MTTTEATTGLTAGARIGFSVSEGLLSRAGAVWLTELGYDVRGYLADLGQCPRADLDVIAGELTATGVPTQVVDLRRPMAELLHDVVTYSARYEDGYWNTTGAARAVLVSQLSPLMVRDELDVFAHASVHGGNDQRRFTGYIQSLCPGLTAYTPWQDPRSADRFADRQGLAAFISSRGLQVGDQVVRSVDGNLGGFSHEAADLESLSGDVAIHRMLSVAATQAPDRCEHFELRIAEGRPVAVDGVETDALELMQRANAAGGRHGLGFLDVLENRLNGTKCRGVYEAPGLTLLHNCLQRLHQATLPAGAARRLRELGAVLGENLYAGRWFDAAADEARAEADTVVAAATGTVDVELYKGNVFPFALRDLPARSAVPRQARFSAGGFRWAVLAEDERAEVAESEPASASSAAPQPPASTATGLGSLTAQQRAALAARLASRRAVATRKIRPRDPRLDEVPAAFAQQRLWFLDRLAAGQPIYNVPIALRLRGALDADALRRAFAEIVARHEILRTALVERDGVPMQVVRPAADVPLAWRDLSRLPPRAREREAERLMRLEAAAPFDLQHDLLVRATVLQLSQDENLLLITGHHLALDGWSLGVLSDELSHLYEAYLSARAPSLRPLPVQYADVSLWHREWNDGPEAAAQLAHWTRHLQDLPILELPTDRPRPDHPPYAGKRLEHRLDDELVPALQRLSQERGATLFMTALAAFQIMMHRYTAQDDIVVASPFAGRSQPETEPLIGMFANMLVMRTQVRGEFSFADVLDQVRDWVLDADENQHVPFERLVDALSPVRDASRNPLFQVSFALQSATGLGFRLPGLAVTDVPVDSGTSRFDLAFNLERRADGYSLWADYSTELWDAERIERMFGHYETLLRAVLADPDALVRDLPLLTAEEFRFLIEEFNDTSRDFPSDATVDGLVARRAATQPDHVAVAMGSRTLTYAQLDAEASALAERLGDLGGVGRIVGVCVDRSPELVVSMLGVMRSGAAYLPLDPGDPPARRALLLDDTGASAVVAVSGSDLDLPADLPVFAPTGAAPAPRSSLNAPMPRHTAADAAYVIFTSGSTGKPKGVVVEHRAVVNFLTQVGRLFNLGPDDRMLQFANPTFDVSVFEIFGSLVTGGTLCMASRETLLAPDRLGEFLKRYGITVMDMAPAVMALLPAAEFASLRVVFVGGEAFSSSLVEAWNLPGRRFFNGYGPTEATVTCIVHECQGPDDTSPPIGRPLGNYRAYVLDRYGNPQPAGIPGELHLAGVGLARGYHDRPDLTAERFPRDPFQPGDERMYRTGDLVHQRWDGEIVFLGRVDRQVKLRGLRIELGEIESVLASCAGVRQAAAQLVGEGATARLVAYVRTEGELDVPALRAELGHTMAAHMIPAQFVRLEVMPLTSSGKIDYARLVAPELGADRDVAYVAPRSETERVLLDAVVSGLLPASEIGTQDNFFDLGGSSLQATQLAARIHATFATEIDLQAVYSAASMAELARLIDTARAASGQADRDERTAIETEVGELTDDQAAQMLAESVDPADADATLDPAEARRLLVARRVRQRAREREVAERITPRPRSTAPVPASLAQTRLWFLDQRSPGQTTYNAPFVFRVRGPLDRAALADALSRLAARHEALRTTFTTVNGMPVQVVHDPVAVELPYTDLTEADPRVRDGEAARLVHACVSEPFDLTVGPLLRTGLVRTAPNEHLFALTVHHIVCDAWSFAVIFRELDSLYAAAAENRPSSLPAPALQYGDFATWERGSAREERFDKDLAYWLNHLADIPTVKLPTDRPRPDVLSGAGARVRLNWDAELASLVADCARQTNTTLQVLMMAALAGLLHLHNDTAASDSTAGAGSQVFGMAVSGRTHAEIEDVVGFFVNTVVMRIETGDNPDLATLVERARTAVIAAAAHQELPFDRLVEELRVSRELTPNPLFHVRMTTHTGGLAAMTKLGALEVTSEPVDLDFAKFDLTFIVAETADRLALEIEYSTDLFDRTTVVEFGARFERVVRAIVTSPRQRLDTVTVLGEQEREGVEASS
ncbi:non-ribosomal peptide synthetase [Rugosimonospora africana]|uniref:Carrier domain-containing protein n=1 Tax=Rugosimonospora africana TaxID=556532 RepID=A0A8J3R084_9ACTN|nr:non-ribosomal peptide synthetase [Rugosimonospora africana]GIH19417.1 hypothetical protein Raf01_75890 [Rugosimonospora africana]